MRPNAIAALVGPEAVHNGLYAEADPLPCLGLDEIEPAGVALVLDQITDPHNVGAILRTAAAFAVSAVVTTARQQRRRPACWRNRPPARSNMCRW